MSVGMKSFETIMQQSAASLIQATAQMEAQAKDVEKKQMEWKELETRVQATLAKAPHLITLDVGGTIFRTSKETLLAVEGSYFHAMLGSGHWKPDVGDAYFLDLHGPTFDRVLIFLKTGKLWLEGLNKCDEAQLRASMDYLKLLNDTTIPPLPSDTCYGWQWDASASSGSFALDVLTKSATKSRDNFVACVVGTVSGTLFQIRLDHFEGSCYVGLQARHQFKAEASLGAHGYFFGVHRGFKCSQLDYHSQPYIGGGGIVAGDVVAMRVKNNAIHFEKNGQDLGPAFTVTDPTAALFPVVCMISRGAVTIFA
ncbi:Aste57867_13608 [Aphanomyces stellatus]|uniref:Aste57867_13608 protein n=1 Tax=Aphanomyces stellatus TaxID=120398 RepID=A0A485KZA4_9STRA|nr:hypothetical protein As57867_013558 [Aphanomyces stellatus]VFT90445.1 Aste57867_13608 [Aphanomyces stellatus]